MSGASTAADRPDDAGAGAPAGAEQRGISANKPGGRRLAYARGFGGRVQHAIQVNPDGTVVPIAICGFRPAGMTDGAGRWRAATAAPRPGVGQCAACRLILATGGVR